MTGTIFVGLKDGGIFRMGIWGLGLAFSTLLALPGSAQQAAESGGRIPVLVVLVDTLPVRGERAVIRRQTHGSPKDLILLTEQTATARQLSAAVFTLLSVHATAGTEPLGDAIIRVRQKEGPSRWIETEERRAERFVRQLRGSNPRHVPGMGRVRARVFTVPAQAFEGRMKQGPNR